MGCTTRFLPILFWIYWITSSLYAENGQVLLLYGVPCAGKSTLSKHLAETLPGNFEVIKRAPYTLQLRMDYIEKVTGTRPKNAKQLKKQEKALPQQYQKNFRTHFKEAAIDPTIEYIRQAYKEGRNVIFDICLYHAHQIDKLQDLDPVLILVYCPIPELSKRELERTRKTRKPILKHQKARQDILAGYCALFQPADDADAIDYLSKQDLLEFCDQTLGDNVSEIFANVLQETTTQFQLAQRSCVGIAPKTPPHVLIHSGHLTIAESVHLICRYLQRKKDAGSI